MLSNFLNFITYVSDDPNDGAEHDETGQHEQCDGGQPSGKFKLFYMKFWKTLVIHFFVKFLRKLA